jgi:hypothetical protein
MNLARTWDRSPVRNQNDPKTMSLSITRPAFIESMRALKASQDESFLSAPRNYALSFETCCPSEQRDC